MELISSDSSRDDEDVEEVIDILEYINSFVPKKPIKISEEMKELPLQKLSSLNSVET